MLEGDPRTGAAPKGLETSLPHEIADRKRAALSQRIQETIAFLQSLQDELDNPHPTQPQNLVNGHVEAELINLLSSEGPGNF